MDADDDDNIEFITVPSQSLPEDQRDYGPFKNYVLDRSGFKLWTHNHDTSTNINASDILNLTVELLSVFIEQVLYYRDVYPTDSFQKVKAFQLMVHQNRHPGVRKYLEELRDSIKDLLNRGSIDRVYIVLYGRPPSNSLKRRKTSSKNFEKLESYGISFSDSLLFNEVSKVYSSVLNRSNDANLRSRLNRTDDNAILRNAMLNSSKISAILTDIKIDTNSFSTDVIYAEYQKFLFSLITDISSLEPLELEAPPTFKILISPRVNKFELSETAENAMSTGLQFNPFLELANREDWILDDIDKDNQEDGESDIRNDKKSDFNSIKELKQFKEVDLGFISVKGYCCRLKLD
ncbi:unnamed protein product [[Candida] boidinii]|uniref:Unnamed protein product n=1 Tax=Candida boidinii TaxID=5477 RepID=A0ACB5TLX9_CANBO|nr:unnamed protein product [[Candida] boidinii]